MTVLVEEGLALTASRLPDSSDSVICVGRVLDHTATLWPAEVPFLEGKSARRRDEFSSGRHLARRAMESAGLPAAPVPSASDRSPSWPAGVCGSLTHSRELAAAGVSCRLRGLGIDLEQAGRLSEAAARRVLVDDEMTTLKALDADFRWLATLVFSAKESVYKAIYPSAGLYIGYREVTIALDLEAATFTAGYLGDKPVNRPLEGGQGAWGQIGDVLLTRFEIRKEGVVRPALSDAAEA